MLHHQACFPSGKQGGAWATVRGIAMVDPCLTQGMGMCRVGVTVDDAQRVPIGIMFFSRHWRGTHNVRWDKTGPVDTIIRKQWQPNI